MGAWEQSLGGTSPGIVHRLEIDQISQNVGANTSVVRIRHLARTQSGTRTGAYDANEVLDGSTKRSVANVGYSWNTNWSQLFSGDYTIGHDSNGNKTVSGSAWLDYAFANGTINGSQPLGRLGIAPTNVAPTASNVGVVTARINGAVTNWGRPNTAHSTPYNFRYRKQGDTTWIERGWGGSTWDISGLTPGTTYEMGLRARNSWPDTSDWTTGTYTFTTLPAPNTNAVMLGIIGVL